jgi:hypothetical protein
MSVATFDGLIVNAWAIYGSASWRGRLDNLNALRHRARASIVWATEMGGYTQGEQLSKAFGWGGKYGKSFILHGGSAPINTAILYDPEKWRLREDIGNTDTRPFITEPGTTHRWASAALLERLDADQLILSGVTHTQYQPHGKNTIPRFDRERYRQVDGFLTKLDEYAEEFEQKYDREIARLGTGDLNSRYGTDPYCKTIGVSRAMVDNGYRDFRLAAEQKSGRPAHIIDRGCYKGKVRVRRHDVLPDRGATDHDTAAHVLLSVG